MAATAETEMARRSSGCWREVVLYFWRQVVGMISGCLVIDPPLVKGDVELLHNRRILLPH